MEDVVSSVTDSEQRPFFRRIANEFTDAPVGEKRKQLANSHTGRVVARAAFLFCLPGASANSFAIYSEKTEIVSSIIHIKKSDVCRNILKGTFAFHWQLCKVLNRVIAGHTNQARLMLLAWLT